MLFSDALLPAEFRPLSYQVIENAVYFNKP